ncbi:MAG: NAD(P)H-hydrate dehydratase [Thermoanaerobaculales bacterium]
MLPVLDNDHMREADRHTISDLGVPSLVLMENAATGVVDALRGRFPDVQSILVLCGRGNNAGDGLAAARHLHNGGHDVRVLLFAEPDRLSPDAATNHKLANAFGVPVEAVGGDDLTALDKALEEGPPDVVIDALLGTGLDRPLAGQLAEVVARIADTGLPVVAVDVPTGLSGSLTALLGPVLPAELTVTFAALKLCHSLPPACLHCGEIVVVDIGIPPAVLERDCRVHWTEAADISLLLPERDIDAHKGHFGHLLIVAGAEGRGGAVAMAGEAAVVAGSGLVTMAVPRPVVPVVDAACLEAMTHPLEATDDGAVAGPEGLEGLLDRVTAAVVGPGMGTGEGAARTLEWLLGAWSGPFLFDADAINLLAGQPERLTERKIQPVLTPHPGELARLLGRSIEDVISDRVAAARDAAARAQAVVVAKGFRTVVADPEGEVWINPTGDSGLASGGSGDVLAGLIGALLAQGLEPTRAAIVGSWLHGRAGEVGGEIYPVAVPAGRLTTFVAQAWRELQET